MIIGGIQWTTLLDYPDRVAATLFTAGCNLRCGFCHNPELVLPERVAQIGKPLTETFVDELTKRRGFLDAIVISGGEPTIQPDLLALMRQIKALGYLVKLDTNGLRPDVLADVLAGDLVDYVAMDIKAPQDDYAQLVGVPIDFRLIEQSVRLIQQQAPDYEFRTTVAPGLTQGQLLQIGDWLRGSKAYWLQLFRTTDKPLVSDACGDRPAMSKNDLEATWQTLRDRFETGGVRC